MTSTPRILRNLLPIALIAFMIPLFFVSSISFVVADEVRQLPNDQTPAIRTIFIAGDSTAANGSDGAIGWGKHLGAMFDPQKMDVVNLARGGRSSRTFLSEGLWDSLLQRIQPGDIVLIQYGHNDGGRLTIQQGQEALCLGSVKRPRRSKTHVLNNARQCIHMDGTCAE